MRWFARAATTSATVAVAGCSLIVDPTDEQCSTDDDCASLSAAGASCVEGMCRLGTGVPAGPWGCLGHISWPGADPNVPIQSAYNFQKLTGRVPIEGLQVLVCRPFDLTCAEPFSTAITDANGFTILNMYKGFNGHVFVPVQEIYPGMMPVLVFAAPPAKSTTEAPGDVVIAQSNELNLIAGLAGSTAVPGYGHVTFTTLDCEGTRAANVVVELEPKSAESTTFYVADNGLPTDALDATSSEAEGGILNVPPGTVNLTATSKDHGVILRTAILVVADAITGVGIAPGEL